MIINEYRVINNCTEEEYQIAQLYATAQTSKDTTGGGEGVEVLKNEPYEKITDKGVEKGQYTYKIYRFASRVPSFVRAVLPASSLVLYEEAWNAYPYCKTVLTNGYMKENFSIVYETLHVNGSRGEIDNALNISEENLKKRNIITIDIANDPVDDKKDKNEPNKYHSEKTGRGPLVDPKWQKNCDPVMTCYKLTTIEFKWFGIQGRTESFIAKTIQNMFTAFHRKLFCLTDEWYGLTIEDIRKIEEQTKKDLDDTRDKETPDSTQ